MIHHPAIERRTDRRRRCGWRKAGALYLVTDGLGKICGKLPIPLVECPILTWIHGAIRSVRKKTEQAYGPEVFAEAMAIIEADEEQQRQRHYSPALIHTTAMLVCCYTLEKELPQWTIGHGCGFRQTRGYQWINGETLAASQVCDHADLAHCVNCLLEVRPALPSLSRSLLIWIGRQYYPRPDDWISEAAQMGISRRLARLPRHFEPGRTRVFAAHPEAIVNPDGSFTPGVVHVFRPRVEYVVRDDETYDQIERLVKRGILPVRVEEDRPLLKEAERKEQACTETAGRSTPRSSAPLN